MRPRLTAVPPRSTSPQPLSRSDQISARRVPVDWPREAEEKSDKNGPLFERSEFGPFRFFLSIAGIGQSSGSPSFGYFSWRSKKSDCPRGISGPWQTRHFTSSNPSLRSGRTGSGEGRNATSPRQTLRYTQGERSETSTFKRRTAALSLPRG